MAASLAIPADAVCCGDYQRHFVQRSDPAVAAWVTGPAGDGVTQAENRRGFDRLALMPRALADLSRASARCDLLGDIHPFPLIIAPMAYHRAVHAEGELATAQAAGLTRTAMAVSTFASATIEEIAARASSPLWFQLYMQPSREDTLVLVRRAEQAGYRALMVTVDAPLGGIRDSEQRAGFRLPEGVSAVNLYPGDGHGGERPAGSSVFDALRDLPTWADIEWLCRATVLPVLVKGILNPADVTPALDAGACGIVVSNHGGRILDGLPASIDALPAVADAAGGRVPVLFDGGIRRGTDILKALALGARAVLIGQPVLHALGVAGMAGVAHLLTILQTELEVAMALAGRPTLAGIDRSLLVSASAQLSSHMQKTSFQRRPQGCS